MKITVNAGALRTVFGISDPRHNKSFPVTILGGRHVKVFRETVQFESISVHHQIHIPDDASSALDRILNSLCVAYEIYY